MATNKKKDSLNYTGKITSYFLQNGRLTLLLTIALFSWGLFSFFETSKQYNPRITAPAFSITVQFPGATRHEILEQVTKPLENVVAQITEVEDIFSTTVEGGYVQAIVNFYVGEDNEKAKITLSDRIRSNLDLAPLGIKEPVIKSIDPDDVPVFALALSSGTLDPIALRKIAFKLRDRMLIVEGTSGISIHGGRRKELAIDIDPVRLARFNTGFSDIESALRNNNIYLPSGFIKNEKAYTPVEAVGTVNAARELENIIIATNDLADLRLKDVARVIEREVEEEHHIRHLGKKKEEKNTVLLSFAKLKDANISDVTTRLRNELDQLSPWLQGQQVDSQVIIDEGHVADKEIGRLVANLVTAILIVVIILFFFLDLRAALLVAVAIPLTLLTVFGIALVSDQSINRITLFALILSLGLLVDNATVVIENIVRHVRENKNEKASGELKDTIINAVSEVGPGLTMSTVTTVLAFIPMAFVTGMMGPYMGPIPFFVPAALVVSLLLAFSINPWLASIVLKKESGNDHQWLKKIQAKLAFVTRAREKVFESFKNYFYSLLAHKGPRRRFLFIILFLLLASFVLPMTGLVKFRMLPKADREQFYVYLDMPEQTSLVETNRVVGLLEDFLLQENEVTSIQSYVGTPPILDFNGLFKGVSNRRLSHQATMRIGLTEPETRPVKSASLVLDLRPRLLKFLANHELNEKAIIKLVEDPPGPPVLSTLLVRVQAFDKTLLRPIVEELIQKIREVDQVVDIDTSLEAEKETITLAVDHARATRSRVSSRQIVDALNTAYEGKIVGLYHNQQNLEQEYIKLRLAKNFRKNQFALKRIYLKNSLNIMVSLQNLVRIEEKPSVPALHRENRQNTAYIYGEMAERSITYSAIDILSLLTGYTPLGSVRTGFSLFGASYRTKDNKQVEISLGGEWELTLEVFRDLGTAMGVAILLIYFVLVGQFSSFRDALIVMSTIPLSLIGVLPGFFVLYFINGIYFNATSMIGVIALAGIAVNNSIILLEYLNSLKKKKMAIVDALFEAGLTRFRPIMLTTITTILGSLTIASDPVWAGLAFAIVMGLGVSSLLTILVFPSLYLAIKKNSWP